ncbi:MAG TPA: hypothetical protein VM915_11660 [Verrucomicrobiae bacterium]|jgi:hypothetical protein|nr:hypothetical protein [Verrucomicrobiae bacterium]
MRIFWVVAALAVTLASPIASAQQIVVADPARHATELSNNMAVGGVMPLRTLYSQISEGAALNASVEAGLMTFERSIAAPRAAHAAVIEDMSLADTYRSIVLYHYYGSTTWIFTRLDYVRIGPTEWALSSAYFGSDWRNVALPDSPSFRSNLGNRR